MIVAFVGVALAIIALMLFVIVIFVFSIGCWIGNVWKSKLDEGEDSEKGLD
jgi:uncharacterized membrane protein YiaA